MPTPEPEPGPAAHPVQAWAEILETVKTDNLAAWIAARDATAEQGRPGPDGEATITLRHHTGALANYINDSAHAAVYAEAAQSVTGQDVRIVAEVGGASAATGVTDAGRSEPPQESPGKAEAAADPQPTPAEQQDGQTTGPDYADNRAGPDKPVDPVAVALQRAKQAESPAVTPAPQSAEPRQRTGGPAEPGGTASNLSGWRARKARIDARRHSAGQDTGDAASDPTGFNGVPLPEEPSEPWDDGPGAVPADPDRAGDPVATSRVDRAEAEEAMAQLDDPASANRDRRSAIEIAGELLERHLGAERTR